MCVLRRSAPWPQLVAISLIGIGVASCSANSGRFGEGFGSSSSTTSRSDVTGSIPQTAPASHIDSRPLPNLASADNGASGGGHGMGSYQPGGEVTGSIAAAPPQPTWTWDGGTAVTVGPGETLESIARRARRAGRRPHGSQSHHERRLGLSGRASRHSALSPCATTAAMPPQTRIASTAPAVAAPSAPAARRAGCADGRACRGARRNAQQHRAALRQAGHGHCQGQ